MNIMGQIGKFMIVTGGFLVVMGIIFIVLNKYMDLNDFPGTIKIEAGNFKLFIPILASIFISILLTLVLNLVVRIINR
jgi:hypothetical protein